MAAQGPKFGRCGQGRAGVLRCRVAGPERACTGGARWQRTGLSLCWGRSWVGSRGCSPIPLGEQGAEGHRSQVEFPPSLTASGRRPRPGLAEHRAGRGQGKLSFHCGRAAGCGAHATPPPSEHQAARCGLGALSAAGSSRRAPGTGHPAVRPARRRTSILPRRPDKLPSSGGRLPRRAALPARRLQAPSPGPASPLLPRSPARSPGRRAGPAQPLQQSPRPRRGRERRRGRHSPAEAPSAGECRVQGQPGRGGQRKGRKVLLSARAPRRSPSPALLPLPERARLSRGGGS